MKHEIGALLSDYTGVAVLCLVIKTCWGGHCPQSQHMSKRLVYKSQNMRASGSAGRLNLHH